MSSKYRFQFYKALHQKMPAIYAEAKKFAEDIGITPEMKGKVELTGPLDFYKTFGSKTGGVIHNGALAVTNVVAAANIDWSVFAELEARTGTRLAYGMFTRLGAAIEHHDVLALLPV